MSSEPTTPTCDREALLSLADRCEKAEGPERELRDEIMLALGWAYRIPDGLKFHYWFDPSGKRIDPPDPLRSLDAAMALVPERMWAEGSLSSPSMMEVHAGGIFEAVGVGTGRTPALALTAACLRALAGDRP